MRIIDKFLDGITMYKVLLYGLMVLAVVSVIFGFLGLTSYPGQNLALSLLILGVVCYISNYIFSKIFKVDTNSESYLITALILFFILFPVTSFSELPVFILVPILAMASKYFLAIHKKHIFNPTAISLFIVGLFGVDVVWWWIGSSALLIPTLILGFFVLRKVKRFTLFFSFMGVAVPSVLTLGYLHDVPLLEMAIQLFTSWPIIFFGTIMLTEPLTTPRERKYQIIYGALVGFLFSLKFEIGPLYATPEFALIIGNIFSYIISPRERFVLTLISKNSLAKDVYDFVWKKDRKVAFSPGQYMEWTLGHKSPDIRGNRRYFTIASSPTEESIHLGVKFYNNSSTFKKKLFSLNSGDKIVASQIAGDFTLPKDKNKKLAFIAGGIGVTPFRSIVKYLMDTSENRDVVMFYSNRTPGDIAYKNLFVEAEGKIGLKTIYAVNDLAGEKQTPNVHVGFIDANLLKKEVPDYKERIFYISGPHSMVNVFEDALKKIGVSKNQIKIDFFPGYV